MPKSQCEWRDLWSWRSLSRHSRAPQLIGARARTHHTDTEGGVGERPAPRPGPARARGAERAPHAPRRPAHGPRQWHCARVERDAPATGEHDKKLFVHVFSHSLEIESNSKHKITVYEIYETRLTFY